MEIDKVYEPQRFEPHWARWWVEHDTFKAQADAGQPCLLYTSDAADE